MSQLATVRYATRPGDPEKLAALVTALSRRESHAELHGGSMVATYSGEGAGLFSSIAKHAKRLTRSVMSNPLARGLAGQAFESARGQAAQQADRLGARVGIAGVGGLAKQVRNPFA